MFAAKSGVCNVASSTTLLPFLYHTSTLSTIFSNPRGPVRRLPRHLPCTRHFVVSSRRRWTDPPDRPPLDRSNIEDNLEYGRAHNIDFDDSAPSGSYQHLTGTYQPKESTITDREKVAFQKIFSDIYERSKKTTPAPTSGPFSINRKQKSKSTLHQILAGAIQARPETTEEYEQAISRFPPALRDDAARALRFGGQTPDHVLTEEERMKQVVLRLKAEELEKMRIPERERVETLMRNAQSDTALWKVMENEVFSMIAKLGLQDTHEEPPSEDSAHKTKGNTSKKPKKKEVEPEEEITPEEHTAPPLHEAMPKSISQKKKAKKAKKVDEKRIGLEEDFQQEPSVITPYETPNSDVSPLQLYGPLYPSHLLLGLRLLDRAFEKPSPLALAVLPQIKSLGFISHVLGASTQFYNDLLRIYQHRYDDYRGMVDLLNEMEQSALDMNEETFGTVMDVMSMQILAEEKPALTALFKMPEYAPGKFEYWQRKISTDLKHRNRAMMGLKRLNEMG